MNKLNTLKWVVVLLVILNIGLMAFLWIGSPKRGGAHEGAFTDRSDVHIKNQFGWDDNKLEKFKKSKAQHIENSSIINKKIKEMSTSYYMSDDNSIKDSLIGLINELNIDVYKLNDIHFNDLRSMSSQDKKQELDEFINQLINRNSGDRKGSHPPPPRHN